MSAQLIHARPLLPYAAADLSEPIKPDIGHTEALQLGDRGVYPLPIAQVDDPDPQRDRPMQRLDDVRPGPGVRASPTSHCGVLAGIVGVVRAGRHSFSW